MFLEWSTTGEMALIGGPKQLFTCVCISNCSWRYNLKAGLEAWLPTCRRCQKYLMVMNLHYEHSWPVSDVMECCARSCVGLLGLVPGQGRGRGSLLRANTVPWQVCAKLKAGAWHCIPASSMLLVHQPQQMMQQVPWTLISLMLLMKD